MKEGKKSRQEGLSQFWTVTFPSHEQGKKEWISTNIKRNSTTEKGYHGWRVHRVKKSLENNTVPLRKLPKNGLDALQIMQRGRNISPLNN